ncbi:MAG: hypothetical protein Q7R93_05230 [bacterium]|nr:hypothetical protein [bacterium]
MKVLYRTKVWKFNDSLLRPLLPREYQLNVLEDRFILKFEPEIEVLYKNVKEVTSQGLYVIIIMKDGNELIFEVPNPIQLVPAAYDAEVIKHAADLAEKMSHFLLRAGK